MTTTIINGIDDLQTRVGEHLGFSPYVEIEQHRIDTFAEATGDRQWIHVDVERARAESPFGGPIAHGLLTLSMGPDLYSAIVRMQGFSMGVNYGCNKVRFTSPVPVGSRLRLGVRLLAADLIEGGVQLTNEFTYELEGQDKPACVAEVIYRQYL